MVMRLKAVELFAGAGGAAVGMESAGVEHLALVEWDRDACATMRAAGLAPVVEGDVRNLAAIDAVTGGARPDILWSSFPCQAWSTAGDRKGATDDRNGWPWTMNAVDHMRPTWLLCENVRGLTLHRGGCGFRGGQDGLFDAAPLSDCPGCYFERVIMPDMRERFAHVGWWLLDAADYGVPQHRRRVIIWGGPAPLVAPAPTHGPRSGRRWVAMGDALGLRDDERACVYATQPEGHATVSERRVRDITAHPCVTIGATYSGQLGGQPWVGAGEALGGRVYCYRAQRTKSATTYSDRVGDCEWHRCPDVEDLTSKPSVTITCHNAGNIPHGRFTSSPWVSVRDALGIHDGAIQSGACHSDTGASGMLCDVGRPAPAVASSSNLYLHRPSPTVSAVGECKGPGPGGNPHKMQRASDALFLSTGRRRLTVEECAKLQAFPDGWPWQGGVSSRYRQVGNAVPPPLAEVVVRAIIRAIGAQA
jgi:DNA-cytosine methyltransferase